MTQEKANAAEKPETTAQDAGGLSVTILMPEGEIKAKSGDIIVVCRQPGLRRAGVEHKAIEVWAKGDLTKKQIDLMRREPLLALIVVG